MLRFAICIVLLTNVAHAKPPYGVQAPITYKKEVRHMRWSPDGKVLAIGVAGEPTVELWSWPEGKAPTRLGRIAWHSFKGEGDAMAIAFSPDGKTLAVAFDGGLLELFSVTGTHIKTLHDERDVQVRAIAFLPGGKSLLWASGDGRTREVDVASGKTVRELTQLPGSVRAYDVAVSPDGRLAVTVGQAGAALLHDLAAGTAVTLPSPNDRELRFASFSPDGTTVLASGSDASLHAWSVADRSVREIEGCTWHDLVAGASLACGSRYNLRFVDVTTGKRVGARMPDLPFDLSTLVYTRDGKRVILADDDGGVRAFDLATRTLDGVPL